MNLAKRSITSTSWNVVANITRVIVGFVRSVLLARLLPVDVFGIYALASSVVVISEIVPNFGMNSAFIHHAPEMEDEQVAAANHLALKLILVLLWVVALVTIAFIFLEGELQLALLVLTAGYGVNHLTQTPTLLLIRNVDHKRLAALQITIVLGTTTVALLLAWMGETLWALLATDVVAALLSVIVLYVWRPIWKPQLAWSADIIRYFLRFGSQSFVATGLLKLLDRLDDFWTGAYLGDIALGYYSRAYTFATYPRQIVAAPIDKVIGGTYANLKGDRLRLSQAFFRTNALLVRTGFVLAGLLALSAPEIITLLLGEKWMPMLNTFRLMLLFTLLDPLKTAVSHLFVAVGKPATLVRARLIQLAVLVAGIFWLGQNYDIVGVALAVDAMIFVGLFLLFWQARTLVDFSVWQLFGAPSIGLVFSLSGVYILFIWFGWLSTITLTTLLMKSVLFVSMYGAVLLMLERRQLFSMYRLVRQIMSRQG